jgi:2-desacetyl-2-hydroxyethyl bacteriochlorophyllide A dehydrogenase
MPVPEIDVTETDLPDRSLPKTARALWTIAPKFCELREEVLPVLGDGDALVRTLVSGISGGTESLVFAGKIPVSEYERMRAPFQRGQFPFPVKYGYAAVGRVEAGPADWIGRQVFVLHPHQDCFVVPVTALTPLSQTIPLDRAVLTANLETALNAVWDAALAPGEKVAIIGAGVVGSLVAAIVSRMPAIELTLIDTDPARAARAAVFNAGFATDADGAGQDFDCVFHTSGHGAGLATALSIAGFEGRIVELSWYGTAPVTLPLGEGFHARRLQIISSQVGTIAHAQRGRFDYRRRMAVVQRLLQDARLDTLIGTHIQFTDLARRIGTLLSQRAGTCPVVHYS